MVLYKRTVDGVNSNVGSVVCSRAVTIAYNDVNPSTSSILSTLINCKLLNVTTLTTICHTTDISLYIFNKKNNIVQLTANAIDTYGEEFSLVTIDCIVVVK